MQRREFLRSAALATVSLPVLGSAQAVPDETVKHVFVVFKCHLDVGFTDTQANVMQKYFTQYYPQAIALASRSRERGEDRYVWTTGSWLLYEYLEQAGSDDRRRMERAVTDGDIAYHALPFSWQTEMLDRSMIEGALGFAAALDARFGKKTIAGKMTDVPGHSRGIVAPLAAHGIRLLDIGVNAGSTPPDVPDLFLWKEPGGASLVMMYHRKDYGSVVRVPHADAAIDVEVRNDNSGPHTPQEIDAIYTKLRQQFPRATITAGSLSDAAAAIEPVRDQLPVITGEIGDTWIYGAPSDPPKVARYREMARLRQEWLASAKFTSGDATDRQLLRRLLLAVEHTWGTDTKSYIDDDHYAPRDLAKVIHQPNYQKMEHSWQEKRDDIDAAIANLPQALRTEADARLQELRVTAPEITGMQAADGAGVLQTPHFEIALDPKTGAITRLLARRSGRDWASASHPLALFSYQTLTQADFTKFIGDYIRIKAWWPPQDFGKPKIDKLPAESRTWQPTLQKLWKGESADGTRLLAELAIVDAAAASRGLVAWPRAIYVDINLPTAAPHVDVTCYAIDKAQNRMPEAMWFSFVPASKAPVDWQLEKVNQMVAPLDVLEGGGRRMHAVTGKIICHSGSDQLTITTLDAPVLAFPPVSPINFSRELPDTQKGVHVSLFNNAWGTNYPQWAGGDWKYRFRLEATWDVCQSRAAPRGSTTARYT